MRNWIILGPVRVRVGSKYLAPWGFPRLEVGGLSLWSWSNTGQFIPASYHPRSSITWLWTVWVGRERGIGRFTAEGRALNARLYAEGNPYAPRPRWFHRFVIPAALKRDQWTHYLHLPFGLTVSVMCQRRMPRRDSDAARRAETACPARVPKHQQARAVRHRPKGIAQPPSGDQ